MDDKILDEIKEEVDRTVREGMETVEALKAEDPEKAKSAEAAYRWKVCEQFEINKLSFDRFTNTDEPSSNSKKIRVIKSVYKKVGIDDRLFEDIEGMAGEFDLVLFECLNNYDPARNDSFYNYFYYMLTRRYQKIFGVAISQKHGGTVAIDEDGIEHKVRARNEQLDEWMENGNEGERALDSRFGDDYTKTPEGAFFNASDLIFTVFTNYTKVLMKLIEDISVKEADGKSTERARDELTRNRLFFTDHIVDVFRQAQNVEVEKYSHMKDLMSVWDEILLSCIFENIPQSAREIMMNKLLLGRELAERFEGTEADETYRTIFETGIKLDEAIRIPVVNSVLIAALFIRKFAETGTVPKPVLDASVSRSRSKFIDSLREMIPNLKKQGFCE